MAISKAPLTKDTTDSTPTTEPKIVAMASPNNADGIFYYGGSREVSPNYAAPYVMSRIPSTDVGGVADPDVAQGNRVRPFDGFGRRGSGWVDNPGVGSLNWPKVAAFGVLVYLLMK